MMDSLITLLDWMDRDGSDPFGFGITSIKNQMRPWMSATVIRTSRSGSSASDRMWCLMVSRTEGLSHLFAISLSIFTHTSLMLGTGSLEAEIIRERAFSRKPSPCTDMQIYFREQIAAILKWKQGSFAMISLKRPTKVFTQATPQALAISGILVMATSLMVDTLSFRQLRIRGSRYFTKSSLFCTFTAKSVRWRVSSSLTLHLASSEQVLREGYSEFMVSAPITSINFTAASIPPFLTS